MNRFGFVLILAPLLLALPAAAESRFEASLKNIDPSERLEQICDYAAVENIGREKRLYRPERAMIDPLSPAQVSGDTMQGIGGAFRSRGKWYQFSFTCQASPDRLKILHFEYRVGEAIPEDKWDGLGLWR